MVNSTSMSSDRSIPDVWDVFGNMGIRRNSWQKMQMSEEERTVNELFNDLHLHADLQPVDNAPKQKNMSNKQRNDDYHNERNNKNNNDWQHIEKHLSMKKTIRKKMMRDLQQAFVDNPSEANQWDVQLDAHKAGVEPNLLDMLKTAENQQKEPHEKPAKKPGFWKKLTMRKSSKR